MQNKKEVHSLYVHIPFCEDICSYCDFTKLIYRKDWAEKYLTALFFEINSYHIKKVKTIYVGGGTPTCLSDEKFEKLLGFLREFKDEDCEFTVECNVESLTNSKLDIMKCYGVNRISIGIQSTHDEVLKLMDRHYTFEKAKKVVKNAKTYFDNINIDLIYAYPNETLEMLKEDIKNFVDFDVPHISTYSLTIDESTKYYRKGYREIDQDTQREFYDEIIHSLRKVAYERYEVSNFAKKGFESLHNQTYWNNEQYYGCGLGASGYIGNLRYTNTKNLNKYLAHEFLDNKEIVDEKDREEYYLMLKLRLKEGFLISEFNNEFNCNFEEKYGVPIKKLINLSLLVNKDGKIFCTDEGIILLDRVLLELLK